MSELGDIMGEDFEAEYQKKRQRAREEASKVSKEMLMEIAYEAIENGGFKGEEPRFRFNGEEVDHDVLLMESPQQDLQKFRHQLGDDAISMGMFHVDELFSLAFQSNMIELVDRIEEDEYYLVVGRYQEKTQTKGDGTEEVYYNINPVRGILPLNVAKKYADKFQEQMEGSSIEEQAEDQGTTEEDDFDLGDDNNEVTEDDVVQIFHAVGNKKAEILEGVASGDEDSIEKLISVTNNNLDGSAEREFILDVFEDNVEEIEGRGEEEEEEDDDLDLGGLDDDEEEDEDEGDDLDMDDSPTDEGSDDSDEESEDPSDWF